MSSRTREWILWGTLAVLGVGILSIYALIAWDIFYPLMRGVP